MSTGPLQPFDWLLLFGVMSGFAVAVTAVRERRTFHLEGPVVASANRIEHMLALVIWAIAFFALVYARLAGIPGEFAVQVLVAALRRQVRDPGDGERDH